MQLGISVRIAAKQLKFTTRELLGVSAKKAAFSRVRLDRGSWSELFES